MTSETLSNAQFMRVAYRRALRSVTNGGSKISELDAIIGSAWRWRQRFPQGYATVHGRHLGR